MPISKQLLLEPPIEDNTIEYSSCQILIVPPNQNDSLVLDG